MSGALTYTVETDPKQAWEPIWKGLKGFNTSVLGDYGHTPLVISLQDADGALRGGIVGGVHLGWLNVSFLWVEDALRGQGHGSELLSRLENLAMSHGATRAFLDSIEFQAVEFYVRHDYVEFGRIKDFVQGFDRVYLWKPLGALESGDDVAGCTPE